MGVKETGMNRVQGHLQSASSQDLDQGHVLLLQSIRSVSMLYDRNRLGEKEGGRPQSQVHRLCHLPTRWHMMNIDCHVMPT